MDASTIAAIATPLGSGGIGIIKISGPNAIGIASQIFRKSTPNSGAENSNNPENTLYTSHRLYHGNIIDPVSEIAIDEVLLSVMRGPCSYTREDVVEINTHSGWLLMQRILKLVLQQGAEPAKPGEFTLRAFSSGRIDLTQAEAIADLINARSESGLKVAAAQLGGELGHRVRAIRERVTRALSLVYAGMDFGDDNDLEDPILESVQILHSDVLPALQALVRRYDNKRYLRIGIRVVIAGKPNVGKSTLMNQLVEKERAIVTPVPGTTRDLIDQQFSIRGIPVILIDTAGLRKSRDPVERIGIQKAQEAVKTADLVLAMIDGSAPCTEEDVNLLKMVKQSTSKVILVINKIDKTGGGSLKDITGMSNGMRNIGVSARYNQNLGNLKEMIFETIMGSQDLNAGSRIIPNVRQADALEKSLKAVWGAITAADRNEWAETLAQELEDALKFLGEVTGETQSEEVLDQVFRDFCIGK